MEANDSCVQLENTSLLFERGNYQDPSWIPTMELPVAIDGYWHVQISCIESVGFLS